MPRLWSATIEAHRAAVHDAVLDAAARLVARHGLRSVTMARIAEESGVGRATLYKYFPDLDAILMAWHERLVGSHLAKLASLHDQSIEPGERLAAVLAAFAAIEHEYHGNAIASLLHDADHVARAREHLVAFVGELIGAAAEAGAIRGDVGPEELAEYCLAALSAAASLPTRASVDRLVAVTMDGLRPATAR